MLGWAVKDFKRRDSLMGQTKQGLALNNPISQHAWEEGEENLCWCKLSYTSTTVSVNLLWVQRTAAQAQSHGTLLTGMSDKDWLNLARPQSSLRPTKPPPVALLQPTSPATSVHPEWLYEQRSNVFSWPNPPLTPSCKQSYQQDQCLK